LKKKINVKVEKSHFLWLENKISLKIYLQYILSQGSHWKIYSIKQMTKIGRTYGLQENGKSSSKRSR
jgi:hypothetical protein